tara:strand:+ start:290 stop:490 length:201 start_codon:yes stop_codon:yes gene_type:complete
MKKSIPENRETKALNIGIVMWRFLLILLIIPCLAADIVGLIPMLIMTKMDEDNSPYPYMQHLFELW